MFKYIIIFSTLVLGVCEINCDPFDWSSISVDGCFGEVNCKRVHKDVVQKATNDGHCTGCGYLKGLKQDCQTVPDDCAPGLKCEYDNVMKENNCVMDKDSCLYSAYVPKLDNSIWVPPKCLPDGTYRPVQCKGEYNTGRCFCTDKIGNRIFGWEWWSEAANMTCACSRRRADLEAGDAVTPGRLDVTLHCDSTGGYEELQCDSGMCWCADERTGRPILGTIVVPEAMLISLPCYKVLDVGAQYLRQCESAYHAQSIIVMSLKRHGTASKMIDLFCDYDGSYGFFQMQQELAYCSWKDKSKITPFQIEALADNLQTINCHCARDTKIFEEEDKELGKVCTQNGNYKPTQQKKAQYYCVDSDGFAITDYFPFGTKPECEMYNSYLRAPDSKM